MMRGSYRSEKIINKLREAEVLLSPGSTIDEAARKIGVTEKTYYRWRREYGGMRIERVKRLKELEKENIRPKRRKMVDTVLKTLRVSERRACRVLGQIRSTQRHISHLRGVKRRI